MFNVAVSPLSKVPSKVFVLIYNSKIGTAFTVFWAVLSTRAVVPETSPVIFLFVKRLKLKSLYKTSIVALFAGAVLNTNFLVSLRILKPEVCNTLLT